jgi:uncharacterized membrane protein
MEHLYEIIRFLHFMSFVFMTIPLFNLIVVNERTALGTSFDYQTDRYMENMIRHGASRCFVFQATVLVTGLLLLIYGDLGLEALWTNWVVLAKTVLLFVLMGLLSHVHFSLQPKIESYLKELTADTPIPDNLVVQLKPYRVRRKWLATLCLFLVITLIILGMQVYNTFHPVMTVVLIAMAALFALKVNKTLIRFGWV